MPQSKKDIRNAQQRKAKAEGTETKLTKSGHPVKAEKPKNKCMKCLKEFVMHPKNKKEQIEHHANKHPKETFDACFPGY
ncbi:hypothetical protein SARC_05467 [Sphaeroforma arctica JP610]|uniref:Uncharacterized protein n=1 Tax=Sphaeroforma arctica JP610 TaxID=667725 RepID=A0A0L0G059_9EUKA|nr:hypothetical protein SARC_05467 [Sphaeroforma arctica JP610]KNC82239.1 hypothetical protein SARC_05467 [Sphaeroforma arctica JP610]|eukprot:XP_014156141.1 hypothetical protein SARC_05467 [Sphaeroforma arctica JP610]